MTKQFHVIGDPIHHSLSPVIHNFWLQQAGLDANYSALHVTQAAFASVLADLAAKGVSGLNVTLPHKSKAIEIAATMSLAAHKIGAANTLTLLSDGSWNADNTDAAGLLIALARNGYESFAGKTALIIGAGGAARAAVHALHEAGSNILILNRTTTRAIDLSQQLTHGIARTGQMSDLDVMADDADFVINTTSAGHEGEAIALPPGRNRLFLDISYGQAADRQLALAQQAGWRIADGLDMLVGQAAESFYIWTGLRPDLSGALLLCRRALEEK